jgi:methionine-rich copper-binding protein CopC
VNHFRNVLLFLLLTVFGCGQQLVEYPLSGPPTVSVTDPPDGGIGVPLHPILHAAFSKAMDPATLTPGTFSLKQGGKVLPATVTYSGTTATLTPAGTLSAGALCTATITTGARDFEGLALAADYVWSFTTRDAPDTTPPTVSFTDPADKDVAVAVGVLLHAAFDEPMDAQTLTAATFTVRQGTTPVAGTVAYDGLTATFVPSSALAAKATFTATITTGARDLAGNALAVDHLWTFSTSDAPPTVTFTDPADQDAAVAVGAKIHAAFSEAMDPATLTTATFTVAQGAMSVPGVVTYDSLAATFTPTSPLAANALVTATITTGARDPAGNALAADHVWTFTTSALPDVTAPAVTFTDPADQAKGVAASTAIQVAFNETMDCATLNTATFTLAQGAVPVSGAVTCSGPTATFTPAGPLTGSPTFTATITTGAKDLNGNALLQSYVWSFETGLPAGEAPVALGAASDYAILAFNTVTNVSNPGTIVTGNLGISPGAAVVGFPPGQVIGQIHAGDSAAAAAKASLLAAYNDAVSRLGAAVLPADLSGLTFTPGLYKNSTSVMLAAGNLTLDAQGNPNAVFIFQMGATLTTNAGTQVVLSGGAKATNIFWAVGTSATLGTNSIFKGTILAASAITMKTGAAMEGRLLAQGAAVALDTNAITKPAP